MTLEEQKRYDEVVESVANIINENPQVFRGLGWLYQHRQGGT